MQPALAAGPPVLIRRISTFSTSLLHRVTASVREDQHFQKVMRGAGIAFALRLAGSVLTFSVGIVVARLLGVEETGLYFLTVSVVAIASVLGKIGLDHTLLRSAASSAAASDWPELRGVSRTGLRMALAGLATVAASLALISPLLADQAFGQPDLKIPLLLAAAATLPLGLSQLLGQLIRGLKRIEYSVLVQSVLVPGFAIVFIGLLAPGAGLRGAVLGYALATLAAVAIAGTLWYRALKAVPKGAAPGHLKDILDSCVPLYMVAILKLVLSWGSIVLLGLFATPTDVGIFTAAHRTAQLLTFVLLAVNAMAAPTFAGLHRSGEHEAIGRVARKAAILLAAVALPPFLLLQAFPEWVLSLYGGDFVGGANALRILAIGQYVNVATGSVGILLVMTRNERYVRANFLITATLNVALNVLLIPIWGITGAAVASASALAAQNLLGALWVKRKLGITTLGLRG